MCCILCILGELKTENQNSFENLLWVSSLFWITFSIWANVPLRIQVSFLDLFSSQTRVLPSGHSLLLIILVLFSISPRSWANLISPSVFHGQPPYHAFLVLNVCSVSADLLFLCCLNRWSWFSYSLPTCSPKHGNLLSIFCSTADFFQAVAVLHTVDPVDPCWFISLWIHV